MLVAGQTADGINGAGILVEQAATQTAHQRCITDAGFQIFCHHAFIGVSLYIQIHTIFEQTGALVFGGLVDRSGTAGNIPDANTSFEGFAHTEASHFLHGLDTIVQAAVLVVGNGTQLVSQFRGERYPRGELFQFGLLRRRQVQGVVCVGGESANQQWENEQMAKECHGASMGIFLFDSEATTSD